MYICALLEGKKPPQLNTKKTCIIKPNQSKKPPLAYSIFLMLEVFCVCMFMCAAWQYIPDDSIVCGHLGCVCDLGFSSLGCKIRHILESNCTVVEAMLEKQDTQSGLGVHCMGRSVGFASETDLF